MKRSSTAPWADKKSALGQKFRKRNNERFRVYKNITERQDRAERNLRATDWRHEQQRGYEDA
jgi:hypothetical protein